MISVVIPAYNEEVGIAHVLTELKQVLASMPGGDTAEMIVVDDGSSDATAIRAEEGGARVVRHPHRIGYGYSLKDGIAVAAHDIIVIADGDGSYPLAEIPRLLARAEQGCDMVVGARTGPHYRESIFKAPLRGILKMLVEFTAGRKVPDANSGLRVFRKSTITPYLPHLSNAFSFTTSLTLVYMLTGRFVEYEPIDYRARLGKTHVRLLRDSLRTLQYIVHSITIYNPIKAFLLLSGAAVLVAMGCFAAAVLGQPWGYAAGVNGLLTAILVFGLGLLADQLKQRGPR